MSIQNVALSGLRAASADLEVTGNNIANSNTPGFKESRTEFGDVIVSSVSGSQIGNGVKIVGVSQDFSMGGNIITSRPLDMALADDGFFMVQSPNGTPTYTRSGNFYTDSDGFIVTQSGQRLQGFTANNGDITASMGDLQIPGDDLAPSATTKASINVNLESSASVPSAPFDATDAATYNHRTSVEVFDSLGGAHIMTSYYVKTVDNQWDVQVEIDGSIASTGEITFDDNGEFLSSTGLDTITFNPGSGAAAGQVINLDVSESTQYGSGNTVRSTSQDGFSTGVLGNIDVSSDGVISARYSNGEVHSIGQVAVATFDNPNGLFQVGDTAWIETRESGTAIVQSKMANNSLNAGVLEASNVNITEQLVNLITAQRNFQANAQSIQAADTVDQTIINLR